MSGVIASLMPCLDDVLGVRDSIGAVKAEVRLVTRTWTGATPGDGTFTDVEVLVLPSPYVVGLNRNIRLIEAGVAQLGDIWVKHISKNKYPDRSVLDSTSPARNVEKFYRVGTTEIYQVVVIEEHYVYWNVMLRKLTDQTR